MNRHVAHHDPPQGTGHELHLISAWRTYAGSTMTGRKRYGWRTGLMLLCASGPALATPLIPALPLPRFPLSSGAVQADRVTFERLQAIRMEPVAPAIIGDLPLSFTLTISLPRQPGQGVLLQSILRNRSDQPVRWNVVPPGQPDFGVVNAQGDVVWTCQESQTYREGQWVTLSARAERHGSCLWHGLDRDGQPIPSGRYFVVSVIRSSDPTRVYGYKSDLWTLCLPLDTISGPVCPPTAIPEVVRR